MGAGRPAMIHEMGGSTAQYSPERVALYDRDMLYSGLAAGSIGFDLWCYTDAAPEQYHKVPYLRTPQETQWGMTTWDRQDKPLALEYQRFSKILGQLDLTGVAPAAADIALVVPDEWSKPHGDFSHLGLTGPEITPYVSQFNGDAIPGQAPPSTTNDNQWLMGSYLSTFVLAHRASLKVDFPREYNDWQKHRMLFMPSPLTSTASYLVHVHTDFYEKAKKYVEGGGFLYASVAADAAIPNMEQLFGARLVDTLTVSEVTLKVVAPFGGLQAGDTFHYSVPAANSRYWGSLLDVKGGQIIAVDQDGRPALVANTLGLGKTLLSAYPLEAYLASMPSAFEKAEDTQRIYEAFRNWTGVKPLFQSNEPSVEVSSLNGDHRGYVVVVNHAAQLRTVTISSTLPMHSINRIQADGQKPIQLSGTRWNMDMAPYEAAILEWK
jgi:hypothetical protein